MESKIIRGDLRVVPEVTSQGTPQAPSSKSVTLLDDLTTRTFEIEGRQEHSLLAISMATLTRPRKCENATGGVGFCVGVASYIVSSSCGIDGRQYIKSASCTGSIATMPNTGEAPTFLTCTAEGNTKTIFVMD